jgi:hypothetical protein
MATGASGMAGTSGVPEAILTLVLCNDTRKKTQVLLASLTNFHFLGVERSNFQPLPFSLPAFGVSKIKNAPTFFFLSLCFSCNS